jgi:hypothetical protein
MIHTYTMEKLTSAYHLSREEVIALCEMTFKGQVSLPMDEADEQNFVKVSVGAIAEALQDCIYSPELIETDIGMDSMKQALNIVARAYRNLSVEADLHGGNFMVRRGSHGGTIVITDPLY